MVRLKMWRQMVSRSIVLPSGREKPDIPSASDHAKAQQKTAFFEGSPGWAHELAHEGAGFDARTYASFCRRRHNLSCVINLTLSMRPLTSAYFTVVSRISCLVDEHTEALP
jgi:hypothetical protein